MRFEELNEFIPHVTGTKLHVAELSLGLGVKLAMPGKHQNDTPIPGGDAVVMASDSEIGWANHPFTHQDIFDDVETKIQADPARAKILMSHYAKILFGEDPDLFLWSRGDWKNSLHPKTFLYSVQALAVIEHRRYAKFEARMGGRFLPARFASGIVEGRWTAADCKAVQRRGRPGVEWLEAQHGKPISLKELAA